MFNEDKNCYTKYPLCISCKSLIRLEEIIISNKKTIYIRFRCVCRTKHKIIELQKYLYGIELLFKLGNKTGIPPDCINCILIKDEKDTHMFTNIMICSELYCIQHKLKSEYCCLQCNIHVCPSCIETDHKEHDYIKDEEFHERTKQKIKSMGDIESYIKSIIQSKHEVIEQSIISQLIQLYSFFIQFFTIEDNEFNYNLCYSVNNLSNISFQDSPYKIIFKHNHILRNFFTNSFITSFLDKSISDMEDYKIKNIIHLNNGNLLFVYYIYTKYSNDLDCKVQSIIFLITDQYMDKVLYKFTRKGLSFISQIKDNIYCIGGYSFCIIWDLSENIPKVLKEYHRENFNFTGGVGLGKNKLMVYGGNILFLFNLNDPIEKFKRITFLKGKVIKRVLLYKKNSIIIVFDSSFIIYDYIKEKVNGKEIFFNKLKWKKPKGITYQLHSCELIQQNILICSLYQKEHKYTMGGVNICFNLSEHTHWFDKSLKPKLFNSYFSLKDEICISSLTNELLMIYNPYTFQELLVVVPDDMIFERLPVIVKLKYNFYIAVNLGYQLEVLYGG